MEGGCKHSELGERKKTENKETRKFILNLSNLCLTLKHDLVDKMETNKPITNTGYLATIVRFKISSEKNELNRSLRKKLKGWGGGKAGRARVKKQKAERWEELKLKAERMPEMH